MNRIGRLLLGAVVLSLSLSLVIASQALAALNFGDDNCAQTPFVVDTALEAARVANGYSCQAVDLTIKTSLTITDQVVTITAKSITVAGKDVLDPLKRVEIINDVNASSDLILLAQNGNITITEGSLKAHRLLKLQCNGTVPLCKVTADSSDLIAAADFANPQPGPGDLFILAQGDVDIRRTNLHGGAHLEVFAKEGSIAVKCGAEPGTCVDPVLSPPFVVKTLCGDPPVFPCTPTFNTPADLQAVCISGSAVKCNGGSVEKAFNAKFDIDIAGSKIDSIAHMDFITKEGNIKAAGAQLTSLASDLNFVTNKGTIDISLATLFAPAGVINVQAQPSCPAAPAVCINAREADLFGKEIVMLAKSGALKGIIDLCGATITDDGADFPTINSDSAPPYSDPSVLDDAVECPTPPGAATID